MRTHLPTRPALLKRAWLPLALGLMLMVAFLLLTSEMIERETADIDAAGLRLAQQWRAASPQFESVMRDLSGFGSGAVLTLLTVTVIGYLWIRGHAARAVMVGVSMGAGQLVVMGLKNFIGRARPDPAFAAYVQNGLSFPSGHASMSAIFFLTVGALLAQQIAQWRVRVYVLCVAALCTGLIGFSRIALGVHWASDVAAGWTFGAGWAALWFCVAQSLHDSAGPSHRMVDG